MGAYRTGVVHMTSRPRKVTSNVPEGRDPEEETRMPNNESADLGTMMSRGRRPAGHSAAAESWSMSQASRFVLVLILVLSVLPATSGLATAAAGFTMGAADSFVVVSKGFLTMDVGTKLNGDIGTASKTAAIAINGRDWGDGAETEAAVAAFSDAIDTAAGIGPVVDWGAPAKELSGLVLSPGRYTVRGALTLAPATARVTLDAGGDPNAVFVIETLGALATTAGSAVLLTGGAQACNVFWKADGAVSIGATGSFLGNIHGTTAAAVTVGAGTSMIGRVFSSGASHSKWRHHHEPESGMSQGRRGCCCCRGCCVRALCFARLQHGPAITGGRVRRCDSRRNGL
jgi:hypothetical protein